MTIVAIADMHGVAGRRGELVALLRDAERDAMRTRGCRRYAVASRLAEPDHYVIVEEWADRAALEAHYATPAFAAFQRALHGLLARPSDLTLHTVTGTVVPRPSGPLDPRDAD